METMYILPNSILKLRPFLGKRSRKKSPMRWANNLKTNAGASWMRYAQQN